MVVGERRASGAIPKDLPVPATLQDSLMARLDRLGSAKAIAQLAAILGREFSYPLLAAIAERDEEFLRRALGRLVGAGLVYANGAEFTFKHALIQDVAYHSLLKSERRRVHGRVARALESQFPERAEAGPELLASHWLGAGEWLAAAIAFDRAGRRAAEHAAYDEAVAHYRRALEAAAELPPSPERDRRELALQILLGNTIMSARGYAAPETLPIWERGIALAEAVSDLAELSSTLNGVATYYLGRGDLGRAVDNAQRILRVAAEHDARVAALRGHCTMCQALFYRGELAAALDHAETAIGIYRPSDFRDVTYGLGTDQGVVAHGFAALPLWWLGRADGALAQARAGVALAEELDSPISLAMAWTFLGAVHHLRGESEAGLRTANEVAALSKQLNFPYWLGFGHLLGGVLEANLGAGDKGLERISRGLELLGRTGNKVGAGFAFTMLADAQLRARRPAEAAATATAGLAIGEEAGAPYCDAELLRLRGESTLARGADARAEAEGDLRRALETARTHHQTAFGLRAATALARLLADEGRPEEARDLLAPVHAGFREGLDTRDLRQARALLDSLR
jgi:predicted ATPase